MPDIWNPQQYEKFGDHRRRPFADLISRVGASAPEAVVDLGCGPGLLTLSLATRWPCARIIGVDSSLEMLDQARRNDRAERVEWVCSDIESWDPAQVDTPVDVITTNALLQWVPSHRQLIPGWIKALAPGGWFAMQVPGNFDAPSHVLLREVAASSPRAVELLPQLRGAEAVSEAAGYAALLAGLDCQVDAWETTYQHILDPGGEQREPVLEWTRGTTLLSVFGVLKGERERSDFVAAYGNALLRAYPRQSFGTIFAFRRIFAVAHKNGSATRMWPPELALGVVGENGAVVARSLAGLQGADTSISCADSTRVSFVCRYLHVATHRPRWSYELESAEVRNHRRSGPALVMAHPGGVRQL